MSGVVVDLGAIQATNRLRGSLATNDKGIPLPTVANLIAILRHDPELRGMLRYDEFACEQLLSRAAPPPDDEADALPGPYPREIGPADFSLIHAYVQRVWIARATSDSLASAIGAVAALNRFHPVREWLSSLQWDGTPRIDRWLQIVFGTPDDAYHREVGAKFLVAAVRRIRQPGCKFDHMLVVEGAQNMGKSTVVRALFSDAWFSDSLAHNLASKDAAIGLRGRWGIEMGEIDQIVRNEPETFKAFMTRQVDIYRPPYSRSDQSFPRQCVIIGTTNRDDYLRDETGNRRTWVLAAQYADVEWVRVNRDQIWAEAAGREAAGSPVYLDDPEIMQAAREHQASRMEGDVWEEPVMEFLKWRTTVTLAEVMTEVLKIPIERQGKGEERRLGKILRSNRWARLVRRVDGKVSRLWEKN